MNQCRLLIAGLILSLLSGCHDAGSTAVVSDTHTEPTPAATQTATTATHANDAATHAITPNPANLSSPAAASTGAELAADGTDDTAAPASWNDYQQSLKRRCETDADCMVKNVGNCCGYYPQCVHRDVQTAPQAIKALCESEQRQSICGFEEPTGCQCVDNQCRNGASSL